MLITNVSNFRIYVKTFFFISTLERSKWTIPTNLLVYRKIELNFTSLMWFVTLFRRKYFIFFRIYPFLSLIEGLAMHTHTFNVHNNNNKKNDLDKTFRMRFRLFLVAYLNIRLSKFLFGYKPQIKVSICNHWTKGMCVFGYMIILCRNISNVSQT